jgi:hypothetical protein
MVPSEKAPTRPPARIIRIAVRDVHGRPATADVKIVINGRPSGSIFTGYGVSESTVEIYDPNASVQLEATMAGLVRRANLPPGENSIRFDFEIETLVRAAAPPVARCPDGTTGVPCVICRDGNDTWKICT